MTEDQIERRVECETNRIDARFMSGRIDQAEYNRLIGELSRWADSQPFEASMLRLNPTPRD